MIFVLIFIFFGFGKRKKCLKLIPKGALTFHFHKFIFRSIMYPKVGVTKRQDNKKSFKNLNNIKVVVQTEI